MHNLVLCVGAVSAFVFAYLLVVQGRASRIRGWKLVDLVPLQLTAAPESAAAQVSDAAVRRVMRRALYVDFGFMLGYWTVFCEVSVLASRRGGWWMALGLLAALTATATALLDAVENVRTLEVLTVAEGERVPEGASSITVSQLRAMRLAALAKWGAAAITVALLAPIFLRPELAAAIVLFAVAGVGILALRWTGLIRWFAFAMFAFLGFLAVYAIGWPEKLAIT